LSLETNKETIDFEKVIGLILSMLFGLVFKDILSSFPFIVKQIVTTFHYKLSHEFSCLIVIVYCIDVFRMLHGYIISLYDKRNPTSFGPYPYDLGELIILVTTFISPLIGAYFLQHFQSPLIFFLAYQGPSLIYLIWDIILHKILNRQLKESNNNNKILVYKKFVQKWLLLDFGNLLIICLLAILYLSIKVDNSYFYLIALLFTLIKFVVIISDYYINNEFYFPLKIPKMPPSGYTKLQSQSIKSFMISISDDLIEENLDSSPIEALIKEIGVIEILLKNEKSELKKNILNLTSWLYKEMLKKKPLNYTDFNSMREEIVKDIETQILDIHLPINGG
jgi:hypothetical protein